MSGLVLDNVEVVYENVHVVSRLNLVIDEGEFVVLLGASGSGKTSILRAIAGFVQISEGKIFASGRRLDTLAVERRNVGVVFQDYALFPHMTVRQNIEFGLRVRRVEVGEKKRLVDEMLDLVDLGQYSKAKPHTLSGGQKQRVALARALVYTPSVLLMDEPLSALDRKLRGGLQEEIRRIVRKAGITTLYVTHDQEEAFNLADRVAILKNGQLTQVASPTELYDNPSSLYNAWFVGEANSIRIKIAKISDSWVQGWWVRENGTEVCKVSAKKGQRNLRSDSSAIGIIRPESVGIAFCGSDSYSEKLDNTNGDFTTNLSLEGIYTTGTIADVREIGAEIRYEIEINGERIKSRTMRKSMTKIGQVGEQVNIEIPPQAILVLPNDDIQVTTNS